MSSSEFVPLFATGKLQMILLKRFNSHLPSVNWIIVLASYGLRKWVIKVKATYPNYMIFSVFLILSLNFVNALVPFTGGIPVPGRTVPIFRLFENYAASCRKGNKKDFSIDQIAQLVESLRMDQVAHKVYNSLFSHMGDMQIEKFMGTWYTVVDSKRIHPEDCSIMQFRMLLHTDYTATFTTQQHAILNRDMVSYVGYGSMVGPDPGETLITTGHPSDPCPYFPIKLGGLNSTGDYEYMILSTPLKYPTIVLARNMEQFQERHSREVYEFVERNGYMSPLAALNTRLTFVDTEICQKVNQLYENGNV